MEKIDPNEPFHKKLFKEGTDNISFEDLKILYPEIELPYHFDKMDSKNQQSWLNFIYNNPEAREDYLKKINNKIEIEQKPIIAQESQNIEPKKQVEPIPDDNQNPPNVPPDQQLGNALAIINVAPNEKSPEEEIKRLRGELAKAEIELDKIVAMRDRGTYSNEEHYKKNEEFLRLKNEYIIQKQSFADSIKNPDLIFEKLVKGEVQAYHDAYKTAKGETGMDKVKEGLKKALMSKAVQGYLKLPKWQRMAINFGIGGIAGLTLGAAGTIGVASYLGWKAARAGVSGLSGTIVGEWANKKWKIEDLEKARNDEIEKLKNSDLSIEEKSKGFSDIENEFKKAKLKMAAKKMGAVVIAGAGTGFLTGLAEGAILNQGLGGSIKTGVVNKFGMTRPTPDFGDKISNEAGFTAQDMSAHKPITTAEALVHKLQERETFNKVDITQNDSLKISDAVVPKDPELPETPKVEVPVSNPEVPDVADKNPVVSDHTNDQVASINEQTDQTASVEIENSFENPIILKHVAVEGDSAWKILEKTLDNNDKFKGMTEAQKTYVISSLTNKVMQDPQCGINGGVLHVGDKTDFTNLFKNPKEVQGIFEKAQSLKPAQMEAILENNKKILTWVKTYPHEHLDESKVSEILNTKPSIKTEEVLGPEFKTANQLEADALIEAGLTKSDNQIASEITPKTEDTSKYFNEEAMRENFNKEMYPDQNIQQNVVPEPYNGPKPMPQPEIIPNKYPAPMPQPDFKTGSVVGGIGMAAAPIISMKAFKDSKEEKLEEFKKGLEEDKKRLEELEAKETNISQLRTFKKDTRVFLSETDISSRSTEAYNNDLDLAYGEKGFLGIGKIEGKDTKEWKVMEGLSADKVIKYCMGDSQDSGLSQQEIDILVKSQKHQNFLNQIKNLLKVSDEQAEYLDKPKGQVKPYVNEKMGHFFKRLGEYVLRNVLTQQQGEDHKQQKLAA